MGLPMAGHLARAELLAAVWNRSHDKARGAAQMVRSLLSLARAGGKDLSS